MPDAKFEFGSFFYFWRYDVTKFKSEEENKSSNSDIYSRKVDLTFKKLVFMSRIVLLDSKLAPHDNFSNFQVEENFSIFKIFAGGLHAKGAAATPHD